MHTKRNAWLQWRRTSFKQTKELSANKCSSFSEWIWINRVNEWGGAGDGLWVSDSNWLWVFERRMMCVNGNVLIWERKLRTRKSFFLWLLFGARWEKKIAQKIQFAVSKKRVRKNTFIQIKWRVYEMRAEKYLCLWFKHEFCHYSNSLAKKALRKFWIWVRERKWRSPSFHPTWNPPDRTNFMGKFALITLCFLNWWMKKAILTWALNQHRKISNICVWNIFHAIHYVKKKRFFFFLEPIAQNSLSIWTTFPFSFALFIFSLPSAFLRTSLDGS